MRLPRPAAVLAATLVLLAPPAAVLADAPPAAAAARARYFTGRAFDSCSAPSLDAMRRWYRHSPYRAAGIYIGGVNRACAQPRLTAGWVRAVDRMGWRLLPVYVGLQPPCRTSPHHRLARIDPRRARAQGRAQAADAVRRARALGLRAGSPLYLDVESYRRNDARCTRAVVDYAVGWTTGLRAARYRSGFYGSAASGIADLAAARRAGRGPLPGTVWFAHWNGRRGTGRTWCLPHHAWRHHRIHQYSGNVRESHGGAALTIDRNSVDAPVAVVRR
ncbi:DUF1906 domain-containing protein [Streptomyces sp. NPDC001380]|uniref:DUF1906 domain-containing protein n=1 Tax=Streptomyces sp. NPDC001380 TaxID=3364566 RepID=UPI0036C39141